MINPEEDDFPLQKGKERLMEAEFLGARGQAFTDRFKEPALCAGDLVLYLTERHQGARIAQIGYQPRKIDAVSRKFPFRVIDLDPENIGSRPFGVTIEGPRRRKMRSGGRTFFWSPDRPW